MNPLGKMDSTNTDLKKTSDIKQMALIGKMHNMQWLKNNAQLSGHIKARSRVKEVTKDIVEGKIDEEAKEKSKVVSFNSISNNLELDNIDAALNKNINKDDNSIINKDTSQSSLNVDSSEKDMNTVWNKDDVTSSLYQNSESLVIQSLDKQESTSMSLADDSVIVKLEQFRLNEDKKDTSNELQDDIDNEWVGIHHDTSNPSKSDSDTSNQANSKQCHDNNNNNAKSKNQSLLDTKKGPQRVGTKFNTKKVTDQKIKKQAGSTLKDFNISLKQNSKSKDNLLNLCGDNRVTVTSMDSKRISIGTTPKFTDKCGKVSGYNKNLSMGKGTQIKEQQCSTLNDSGNRNRSSTEGLVEKSKSVTTKLKSPKTESEKKCSEVVEDTRKCHKVQVTRTQSYNVQYNRSKPLIKSQQQYLRSTTKPEEDSINNSRSFNNISASNSTKNILKKKYENQQRLINKQINDMQSNQNISGQDTKNTNVSEYDIKSSSVPCRRSYQNLSNTKNANDMCVKDDQTHMQKFKTDSNVYKRFEGALQTSFKDLKGKAKTDVRKINTASNNLTRDYRLNRQSVVDSKVHSQFEGSKITVYSYKTSNCASNIKKTDTLGSITVSNVQSVNSVLSSTKDSTTVNTSQSSSVSTSYAAQESQVLHTSCNENQLQVLKTEQEDISNNNSDNKTCTANSETKSVNFLDNIQELNVTQDSQTYTDNSIRDNELSLNSYYCNLQNASSTNSGHCTRSQKDVPNKSYLDNDNNIQCCNINVNVQNTEQDLQSLDAVHQKSEQASQISSPQSILPHTIGNGLHLQNIPAMYLNQYNNAQTIPRKTAESTIVSQNVLIPSTSSYTLDNQNIIQNDPSSILMHNTQTSVIPPPNFHNHAVNTQQTQWNLTVPDIFLFGNMVNSLHPLNIPMQNSRQACNTEFNSIQQTGYLHHPLFYTSPLCLQNWNPLLQYSPSLFQNSSPYTDCNTFPNQVSPASTVTDSMNCNLPVSMQNNSYKYFQQMRSMENPPNFSVPVKLDNYMGNMQDSKSNNIRLKDNNMDVHMRTSRYQVPVPNEYQNCSQDAQPMIPFSYAVTVDSIAKNCPPNVQMQVNQKYTPRIVTTATYSRMSDICSTSFSGQNCNNRKDDASRNDYECIPPMVSPRECMYYGLNYPRNTDNNQNLSARSDVKSTSYTHSVNMQRYISQYQRDAGHPASSKDASPRVITGRGMRRSMDH